MPPVRFMFTLDQIAYLLSVDINKLRDMVSFDDGYKGQAKMRAVNILPSELHKSSEWRIPYDEFVRYCKRRGIVIYEQLMR